MTNLARLSTCGRCGGTIRQAPGSVYGWGHIAETPRNADGHRPDPDDGYVSRPSDDEDQD